MGKNGHWNHCGFPQEPYKSIASIPGATEDQVWCVVNRLVNGSSVYYVEKFGPILVGELDEALSADSAKKVESAYSPVIIMVASETVRCGEGPCNAGPCGGVP